MWLGISRDRERRDSPSLRGRILGGIRGFTLIELLVAAAVMMVLLGILLQVTSQTSAVVTRTTGKIEQFREARDAFEALSRNIAQATLNTYWDYDNPNSPTRYTRQSELRFLIGDMQVIAGAPPGGREWTSMGIFFQAPLGFSFDPDSRELTAILNTVGYFVEYGDGSDFSPSVLSSSATKRWRLCEFLEDSSLLSIFSYTSGYTNASATIRKANVYSGREWFQSALSRPASGPVSGRRPVRVLAENVIALILLPKLGTEADPTGVRLSPTFSYDSTDQDSDPAINPKNQLPPVVQITMVAIDEASAERLSDADASEINNRIKGLFRNASAFESDLRVDPSGGGNSLEALLIQKRLNYQIFTSNINIQGAKWSQEQAN